MPTPPQKACPWPALMTPTALSSTVLWASPLPLSPAFSLRVSSQPYSAHQDVLMVFSEAFPQPSRLLLASQPGPQLLSLPYELMQLQSPLQLSAPVGTAHGSHRLAAHSPGESGPSGSGEPEGAYSWSLCKPVVLDSGRSKPRRAVQGSGLMCRAVGSYAGKQWELGAGSWGLSSRPAGLAADLMEGGE